jgi:hypothetical protein
VICKHRISNFCFVELLGLSQFLRAGVSEVDSNIEGNCHKLYKRLCSRLNLLKVLSRFENIANISDNRISFLIVESVAFE